MQSDRDSDKKKTSSLFQEQPVPALNNFKFFR
jgi:hypothetical protein